MKIATLVDRQRRSGWKKEVSIHPGLGEPCGCRLVDMQIVWYPISYPMPRYKKGRFPDIHDQLLGHVPKFPKDYDRRRRVSVGWNQQRPQDHSHLP